jgi:formylglycine-generating enzyme
VNRILFFYALLVLGSCTFRVPQKHYLQNIPDFVAKPYLVGMILIPEGSFTQGDSNWKHIYGPPHKVYVDAFYMDQKLVTQSEFLSITKRNDSFFSNCPLCPVERVTWLDAARFANLKSEMMGLEPVYNLYTGELDTNKYGYKLPSEAQWEYAAYAMGRGCSNDSLRGDAIWHKKNSGLKTQPVGLLAENDFGLWDMCGNVWQWTNDWYEPYLGEEKRNPKGAKYGEWKVVKGGSFKEDLPIIKQGMRYEVVPDTRQKNIGFRLVLPYKH